MKRILIPLDGSKFAERSFGPALYLAGRENAEVHLVSVVSDAPPVPMAFSDESLVSRWIDEETEKVREYLAGAAGRAAERSPDVPVTTHVRVGRVSRTLRDVADELEVDLIVLTTHGRGAVRRMWLGSTADQLLRSVPRPILLLPAPKKDGPEVEFGSIRHVLIPLDGSLAAESALDALPDLISPDLGVRLTVAHVVAEPILLPDVYLPHQIWEDSIREEHRESAESYLNGVGDRLKAIGFRLVEARVLSGEDSAHALLDFADQSDVGLIALSTHGRGGVSRFFLGSVADKMIRGSHTPVLVTRRPSDEDE